MIFPDLSTIFGHLFHFKIKYYTSSDFHDFVCPIYSSLATCIWFFYVCPEVISNFQSSFICRGGNSGKIPTFISTSPRCSGTTHVVFAWKGEKPIVKLETSAQLYQGQLKPTRNQQLAMQATEGQRLMEAIVKDSYISTCLTWLKMDNLVCLIRF